jgi:hypothetical protein
MLCLYARNVQEMDRYDTALDRMRDVVPLILLYLPFSDKVALSHTAHRFRLQQKELTRTRVLSAISQLGVDDASSFAEIWADTQMAIIGSTSLFVLQSSSSWKPTDLNLWMRKEYLKQWLCWVRENEFDANEESVEDCYTYLLHSFWVISKENVCRFWNFPITHH